MNGILILRSTASREIGNAMLDLSWFHVSFDYAMILKHMLEIAPEIIKLCH